MTPEQITTITTNILVGIFQSGGLGFFFYQIIKGIKAKVAAMDETIAVQNKTLEIMEKRASEAEKIGAFYKNFIDDIPKTIENYKAIISHTKDSIIFELKNSNEQKDSEIKKLKEIEKTYNLTPANHKDQRKALRAALFLSGKDGKELGDFYSHFEGALEANIPIILTSNSFKESLSKLDVDLDIDNDGSHYMDLTKRFNSQENIHSIRVLSYGGKGCYVLFQNGKLNMNDSMISFLSREFEIFKNYLN